MGSSHLQSDKLLDEFFSVLLLAPVWFGPISAAGIYAAFRWLFPWSLTAGFAGQQAFKLPVDVFSGLSMTFAPWFAGLVLVIWGIAEFRKRTDRKRFDKVTDAKSIADLSWSEFESLISEAFRRQGYTVDQLGGGCPDGGIDHRLSKAGEVVLVQCKHWKNWKNWSEGRAGATGSGDQRRRSGRNRRYLWAVHSGCEGVCPKGSDPTY